jgi:hypothetical protein
MRNAARFHDVAEQAQVGDVETFLGQHLPPIRSQLIHAHAEGDESLTGEVVAQPEIGGEGDDH